MKTSFRFCGYSFYTAKHPTAKAFDGLGTWTQDILPDQITSIRLAL